jgi:hypothetical protein
MSEVIEGLFSKCKALSSNPSTIKKKIQGQVVYLGDDPRKHQQEKLWDWEWKEGGTVGRRWNLWEVGPGGRSLGHWTWCEVVPVRSLEFLREDSYKRSKPGPA